MMTQVQGDKPYSLLYVRRTLNLLNFQNIFSMIGMVFFFYL